jgi:hypothetical protein
MEFLISDAKKLEILNSTLDSQRQELYVTLVRLGIDPDTFDESKWSEPSPVTTHDEHKVTLLIASIDLTQNKIAAID